MVQGLLGKKIGMTQLFDDGGRAAAVTVLRVGPCIVVQRRTRERDGYEAAQLGLVEDRPPRRATKPALGHFQAAGAPPTRVLREFRLQPGADAKPGDTLTCELFKVGDAVDVIGASKGRGFQGVVRRHHFRGGAATHGSMFHRAPGSIGASAWPSRTIPGTRMGGRMGVRRMTVKRLQVVQIDPERNLVVVRGAVPGARGSLVTVRFHRSGGVGRED